MSFMHLESIPRVILLYAEHSLTLSVKCNDSVSFSFSLFCFPQKSMSRVRRNRKVTKMREQEIFAESEFQKLLSCELFASTKELDVNSLLTLAHEKGFPFQEEKEEETGLQRRKGSSWTRVLILVTLGLALLFSSPSSGIYIRKGIAQLLLWRKGLLENADDLPCAITMPSSMQNAFMPQFDCSRCERLESVPKLAQITPNEFTLR